MAVSILLFSHLSHNQGNISLKSVMRIEGVEPTQEFLLSEPKSDASQPKIAPYPQILFIIFLGERLEHSQAFFKADGTKNRWTTFILPENKNYFFQKTNFTGIRVTSCILFPSGMMLVSR